MDLKNFILNNLDFILGLLIIPFLIFLLNIIVRAQKNIQLSTTADWLLFLIVFDFNVLLTPKVFEFVANNSWKKYIIHTHIVFILVSLIIWFTCLTRIEPKLHLLLSNDQKQLGIKDTVFIYGEWVFVWAVTTSITSLHIIMYSR